MPFSIEVPAVRHPKGMESFSPGLRGTSYPATLGVLVTQVFNPGRALEGLYQLLSMNTHAPIYGAEERHDEGAATLSGLMGLLFVSPRVARSSQPWAERCNPFGIERDGPVARPQRGGGALLFALSQHRRCGGRRVQAHRLAL